MVLKNSYIEFTKMQGAGNDFVIIDNRDGTYPTEKIINLTPEICNRHFGVGGDGVIALQPPAASNVDYTMLYRNADGSDAGMCGNGARCLALFASENSFNSNLTFNVHDTIYRAVVGPQNQVEIGFPFEVEVEQITLDDSTVLQVNTGTEHVVKQIPAAELKNDDQLIENGRKLRQAEQFNPPGTNVNFIHGISENTLLLRTYEKGVENLTLACGTGAIASAIAWHHMQALGGRNYHSIIVKADGGTLQAGFHYDEEENIYRNIKLTGQAQFVFTGRYKI